MASNNGEEIAQDKEDVTTVLEDKCSFIDDETQDSILHLRSKLCICIEGKEWEEKDVCVDFVKHKESGTVRLLIRHYPSLQVIAKHPIMPTMELEEYAGKHNSCKWNATDFQDGELKNQIFRVEFFTTEDWEAFIENFEDVIETQSKKEGNKNANAAAGFLEKVGVDET
ncbi:hypothetical protein BVRB_5g102990 [Beta vulgaris subsp. vulgaris]|uniref:ran-binding protein 1 homolog b n=1 Tax=Beta vulgaris subsp. vulgaris TaxID=3555 RepID=UPI00053FFA63|nr:ran-binding protein 1 homolog b [Beta vulgaris subsp. vulgaris]KMT12364.1 hypothetical protein BVRB_5g102990 [Beta vulgaris subsp. vulgaris]